jgi:hypothetical protein
MSEHLYPSVLAGACVAQSLFCCVVCSWSLFVPFVLCSFGHCNVALTIFGECSKLFGKTIMSAYISALQF